MFKRKYFYILTLLFLTQSVILCQENFTSKINWKNIEADVSDSIKINYMKLLKSNDYVDTDKLFEESSYHSKEIYNDFINTELSKFHLLDINNDSLLDVIYEGRMPFGIEINDIVIYIRKNDSLEVALKVMGEFDNLYINNNKLDSMIVVVNPCCAGFYFTKRFYSFLKSTNKGNLCQSDLIIGKYSSGYEEFFSNLLPCYLKEEEYFDYHVLVKPKYNLKTNNQFKSINNFYITTNLSKVVNKKIEVDVDMSYFAFGNKNYRNNQIGLYKKGSQGIILAISKDIKGIEYAFVRISNNYNIQSIFKKKDVFIYGWTKLSNLKKIE